MEINTKMISWTIINAVWWLASILLDFYLGIDVNPLLNDLGEVVLNVGVYIIGMILILTSSTDIGEKKDDVDKLCKDGD